MSFVVIFLLALLVILSIINLLAVAKSKNNERDAILLTEIKALIGALPETLRLQEQALRGELADNRGELAKNLAIGRNEISVSFKSIRETLDVQLQRLQEENSRKLEEMRKTVDEKLQESVEKRFRESFKSISERLEMVQKGLGEMQTLATGVGDLKRVLTNVKTRGTLGEIQLANLLEQSLTAEQYVVNAQVKPGSSERVEFAIKMPGKDPDAAAVLLPIDSKFPVEDYQRLLDAYDNAQSPDELKKSANSFEQSVLRCAGDIKNKYINPPLTTDFAVMFVPTEGLYAEVLRRPGLFERLQHDFHITIVGPANLMAFLNSLQMGFRTLAIEKRSGEVWNLLGAVKTELGKFGAVLEKTREHLERAVKDIDDAGIRTRAIERKLRTVTELPPEEAAGMIDE